MKKQIYLLLLLINTSLFAQESCMKIGTNFHFFGSGVFKDLKKSSSKFYTRNETYIENHAHNWDSNLADTMDQDANGYPLEVPFNHPTTGLPQIVAFTAGGHIGNYKTGNYVLLYDGEGELELVNWVAATVTNSSPGRIEFTVDEVNENGVHFLLKRTTRGNHIRNIRIFEAAYESNYLTDPYMPEFASKIRSFGTLRFMDWVKTNNHPISNWNDRMQPNYHTQDHDQKGMAWEHIIAMANYFDIDLWITVPHLADQNYMDSLATLFRDTLESDRTIYLEYSNEGWNFIFEQTHWLNHADRPFGASPGKNYGYFSNLLFMRWDAIFGAESNRIKTVMAGHDYFVIDAMEYMETQNNIHLVDLVSYPGYVALNEANYDTLDALGATATATQVLDMLEANKAHDFHWMQQFKTLVADRWNKDFVMYEGGQHITPRHFGLQTDYNQALYDAQTHPRMAQFYTDLLNYYKNTLNVTLFMNYVLASEQESPFGSWGLLENYMVNESSVKWDALMNWIAANTCTLSISEENTLKANLYPNPTQKYLSIQLPTNDIAKLIITDVLGRIVHKESTNTNATVIDISTFKKGIYICTITQNNKKSSVKFIKE